MHIYDPNVEESISSNFNCEYYFSSNVINSTDHTIFKPLLHILIMRLASQALHLKYDLMIA